MKIITFLGNPGKKYAKNRHNIGFIIGEYFANKYNIKVKQKGFSGIYGTGKCKGEDFILLFPQTFMNLSGKSVNQALNYYKEDISNLIVVHDEIELKFADIREKTGGGHKGHNGLRSIIAETGSPDFHRVRYGVGRPENPNISVADFVLGNFTKDEMNKINENSNSTIEMIESLF